jgi:hypothetical protein
MTKIATHEFVLPAGKRIRVTRDDDEQGQLSRVLAAVEAAAQRGDSYFTVLLPGEGGSLDFEFRIDLDAYRAAQR